MSNILWLVSLALYLEFSHPFLWDVISNLFWQVGLQQQKVEKSGQQTEREKYVLFLKKNNNKGNNKQLKN